MSMGRSSVLDESARNGNLRTRVHSTYTLEKEMLFIVGQQQVMIDQNVWNVSLNQELVPDFAYSLLSNI